MIELLLVSIGGFFGAICRFALSKLIQSRNKTSFPFGTFIVNLSGAFLLGLLFGIQINGQLNALFGVGFMGAFTTFSTLKLEAEQLREAKKVSVFYRYLFFTYGLGLIFTFCGIIVGKGI
ncbi:fluoride efflux transporter CrcB [Neobacillus pocheonensis]|uniref:fluoride efflux transporter CrcB n=1 Tax=Neobacillus pocheonensis TaxID=363869 RepID=UPI003D269FD9